MSLTTSLSEIWRFLTDNKIKIFIGAFIIALLAAIGNMLIPGGELGVIIISSVMPIVPGVLITNAIQDLFGGHMLMAITKLLEALVTAFGIGAGVATVLILL